MVQNTAYQGNNRLLPCIRCENWSHFACPGPKIPKSPYLCPPCMSPNFRYYDWSNNRRKGKESIEKDAAMQLLGAAKIAAITVAKAATIARVESERRVKDAALARKRAREAIDRVMAVADKVRSEGSGGIVSVPEPISVVLPQEKDGCAGVENGGSNNNAVMK
ncbi:hypothetical protein KSS87_022759 [Heliosperma pusillum]|nr:hypothetical protein KSS87_022759 [Heliosperma pusillum]